MRWIATVIFWMVLAPSAAWACPGCVTEAYGDRTFGWAYLSLYVAPLIIAAAIAGVLAYHFRATRPDGPAVRGEPMTPVDKETT